MDWGGQSNILEVGMYEKNIYIYHESTFPKQGMKKISTLEYVGKVNEEDI